MSEDTRLAQGSKVWVDGVQGATTLEMPFLKRGKWVVIVDVTSTPVGLERLTVREELPED